MKKLEYFGILVTDIVFLIVCLIATGMFLFDIFRGFGKEPALVLMMEALVAFLLGYLAKFFFIEIKQLKQKK